jgi:ATP-binding cassette, subfamily F, member 3
VLVASGANALVLDEPTNHLDLDAREALEDALLAFDGAVLLVSHDRALLDAVGTRTIAFEEGRLRSYEGGWAEYARVREERREREASAQQQRRADKQERRAAKSAGNGRARPAGPSKNAVRRIGELEREVERREAALRRLEDELADPTMWSSPSRTERNTKRHAAAKRAVEEAYSAWEKATVADVGR